MKSASKANPLPYSHQVPYWKTSKSGWTSFISKAVKELKKVGGSHHGTAVTTGAKNEEMHLRFSLEGEEYHIVWPILPLRPTTQPSKVDADSESARVQAATFIFHDVKARCVAARILGANRAFFTYQLVDGRPVQEVVADPLLLSTLAEGGGWEVGE